MATLYSYALTTVADVKELMGIDSGDSSKNNIIIRKINQATDMIESYCLLPYNHHFKETTYTDEEYSGTYADNLSLLMRPVTDIASFGYRNTPGNVNQWTAFEDDDFYLDEDTGSILTDFTIYGGWNTFRVTYTAGFDPIPADLAEAAAMLAANLVENAQSGQGVVSKTEGSRSITYATNSAEKSLIEQLGIDDVLHRYVRVSLGGV